MTLLTIVLRNGTLIKFDAESAATSPNVLNPAGFNYQFKGAGVPKLLHLRTEQVDAVVFGDVLIGDQLLSPQPATPPPVPPAAPAPAAPAAAAAATPVK